LKIGNNYDGIILPYTLDAFSGTVVLTNISKEYKGFIVPDDPSYSSGTKLSEDFKIKILREYTITCPFSQKTQKVCDIRLYLDTVLKCFPMELIQLSTYYKLKTKL